jgi:hypothetical protein
MTGSPRVHNRWDDGRLQGRLGLGGVQEKLGISISFKRTMQKIDQMILRLKHKAENVTWFHADYLPCCFPTILLLRKTINILG